MIKIIFINPATGEEYGKTEGVMDVHAIMDNLRASGFADTPTGTGECFRLVAHDTLYVYQTPAQEVAVERPEGAEISSQNIVDTSTNKGTS